MIIEFIGPSGSGKSTLAGRVADRTEGAQLASDLVLRRWGLPNLEHPTGRNLVADVGSMAEAPRFGHQHRAFVRYALGYLGGDRSLGWQTLNYGRSVLRRAGIDHYCRRRHPNTITLADEGVLLTTYLLFGYGRRRYDGDDLDQFVSLVPLPDLVVHVRAPLETLSARSGARPDGRRELTRGDRRDAEKQLATASELFERLAVQLRLRSRVVEVDNPDRSPHEREEMVDRIVHAVGEVRTEGGPNMFEGSR